MTRRLRLGFSNTPFTPQKLGSCPPSRSSNELSSLLLLPEGSVAGATAISPVSVVSPLFLTRPSPSAVCCPEPPALEPLVVDIANSKSRGVLSVEFLPEDVTVAPAAEFPDFSLLAARCTTMAA